MTLLKNILVLSAILIGHSHRHRLTVALDVKADLKASASNKVLALNHTESEMRGTRVPLPPSIVLRRRFSENLGREVKPRDLDIRKFGAWFTRSLVGEVPPGANELDELMISHPLDILAYWLKTRFLTRFLDGDENDFKSWKWQVVSTDKERLAEKSDGLMAAPLYMLRILAESVFAPDVAAFCKELRDERYAKKCPERESLVFDGVKMFLNSLATAIEPFLHVPLQEDFCDDECRKNCHGTSKEWCSLDSHKCKDPNDKPKHVDCSGPELTWQIEIAQEYKAEAAKFKGEDGMDRLRDVMTSCCPAMDDCLKCRHTVRMYTPSSKETDLYLHLATAIVERLALKPGFS